MVTHLLILCKKELNISELPPIVFIQDSPTIQGGTSFGQFSNDGIEVVTMNRHPVDIVRTLAHELVHWQQSVSGQELDGSDGSSTENDANAVAGVIMRKFAKKYPDYFLSTLP